VHPRPDHTRRVATDHPHSVTGFLRVNHFAGVATASWRHTAVLFRWSTSPFHPTQSHGSGSLHHRRAAAGTLGHRLSAWNHARTPSPTGTLHYPVRNHHRLPVHSRLTTTVLMKLSDRAPYTETTFKLHKSITRSSKSLALVSMSHGLVESSIRQRVIGLLEDRRERKLFQRSWRRGDVSRSQPMPFERNRDAMQRRLSRNDAAARRRSTLTEAHCSWRQHGRRLSAVSSARESPQRPQSVSLGPSAACFSLLTPLSHVAIAADATPCVSRKRSATIPGKKRPSERGAMKMSTFRELDTFSVWLSVSISWDSHTSSDDLQLWSSTPHASPLNESSRECWPAARCWWCVTRNSLSPALARWRLQQSVTAALIGWRWRRCPNNHVTSPFARAAAAGVRYRNSANSARSSPTAAAETAVNNSDVLVHEIVLPSSTKVQIFSYSGLL